MPILGVHKGGQADSLPQCSFVPNGTSLAQLQPAAYHQRYAKITDVELKMKLIKATLSSEAQEN
ncbi:MAG: hypothetical protein L3J98_02930 [Gammaproteobacteria bacterium]|nr:hypothetical protein [Gammaproteobacteria bacterium]